MPKKFAEPWLKWIQYALLNSFLANTEPFHKLAYTCSLYLGLFWTPQNLKDSIRLHERPRKQEIVVLVWFSKNSASSKMRCFFPIVIVSLAPHREFEQNDHREDAPHFEMLMSPIFVINSLSLVTFHHICQYIHKLISHMVRQIIF